MKELDFLVNLHAVHCLWPHKKDPFVCSHVCDCTVGSLYRLGAIFCPIVGAFLEIYLIPGFMMVLRLSCPSRIGRCFFIIFVIASN